MKASSSPPFNQKLNKQLPQRTEGELAPSLGPGLWVSLGLHGVVLAALIFRAVFYPTEPIKMQHAIRVDMVALPDAKPTLPAPPQTQLQNKPEPKPEPKVEPKPETQPPAPQPIAPSVPKLNVKKSIKAETNALKRLEAMNRLENAEKAAPQKPAATAILKGNVISPGTSLTGLSKIESADYISSLDDRIKQFWNLPAWLANANLKARVTVYLDARGVVIKKVLTQGSANSVFNDKCMEAIDKASPFPPPPARLASIFAVDGFEVGFPE